MKYPSTTEEALEYQALVEREALIFQAQEAITSLMQERAITRSQIADNLNVSRAAVTQALADGRNMTLATFARYLHAMGHRAKIETELIE